MELARQLVPRSVAVEAAKPAWGWPRTALTLARELLVVPMHGVSTGRCSGPVANRHVARSHPTGGVQSLGDWGGQTLGGRFWLNGMNQ